MSEAREDYVNGCERCHHVNTYWNDKYGCGATLSSGPCSSDYSYCKCKDDYHAANRCEEITNNGRCKRAKYYHGIGCTEHLTLLQIAQKDLEYQRDMAEYSRKKAEEILNYKIKDAKTFLEENGYICTKVN